VAEALPVLMFAALAVLLFCGFPVAFVLGGVALAFGLIGIALDAFAFVQFHNIVARAWGGIAESLILTAVPMFILMGTMLEKSGIARDLLRCLQVLLRRVPGGLALSVTLMGTIMAATTGIIGASVVMMTLLALPMMLAARYDPALSAGTIAAAGTLGILIPPSIMLVVMADLLAKSVGVLFFAAFVPGFLLSFLYLGYIAVYCALRPERAPPLPAGAGPAGGRALARLVAVAFVPAVLLVFLVLGSILLGWASPTEAAGVGAFGAIVLAGLLKPALAARLGDADGTAPPRGQRMAAFRAALRGFPAVLAEVVDRSALTGAMLFMIFIGATAFSFVFRALGGDDVVVGFVEASGLGPWGLLVAVMALVFALGFFFDWIEITLIVLPVFAPLIEAMDFGDHVARGDVLYWFAILMALNLQTSFLTPPFGFALFYVRGAAPAAVPTTAIWRGAMPFVALQLCGLGLVMAFPGLALWLPRAFLD